MHLLREVCRCVHLLGEVYRCVYLLGEVYAFIEGGVCIYWGRCMYVD